MNGPILKSHILRNRLKAGPITRPICLVAMNNENTLVRCFFDVVRANSPNNTAPPDIPIPVQ